MQAIQHPVGTERQVRSVQELYGGEAALERRSDSRDPYQARSLSAEAVDQKFTDQIHAGPALLCVITNYRNAKRSLVSPPIVSDHD
jgi:hypothetical protein